MNANGLDIPALRQYLASKGSEALLAEFSGGTGAMSVSLCSGGGIVRCRELCDGIAFLRRMCLCESELGGGCCVR